MRAHCPLLFSPALLVSWGMFPIPVAAADAGAALRGWDDGNAEVSAYRLEQPRYGQIRQGTAVLIFVKEDFSESSRVKADPGRHAPVDVFPVLKLNVVKDFQTGVYDYNLMTSIFVGLSPHGGRPEGVPSKIVFSAQEWCGALFEEILFDPKALQQKRFSYFDGEGDEARTLPFPSGGVAVDQLPFLARSLPTSRLEPGASEKVSAFPSLERARLLHRRLEWTPAKLSRSDRTTSVSVPAGVYDVETWVLEIDGGDRYAYEIEARSPKRVIAWRGPDGEHARLLGSNRMRYWDLHDEGHQRFLKTIGLEPPRPPSD